MTCPEKKSPDRSVKVSIIIPVYNRPDDIRRCLNSLTAQAEEAGAEIIVVDSSDDDTPEVIRREFPGVKLIRLEKQTRQGGARNVGVRYSTGEIIAFTDSDCKANPHWLEKGLKSLQNGADITGGTIKNGNPKSPFSVADHLLTFRDFLPGFPLKKLIFIPTCNLFCRKSDFKKIGGFREEYPLSEDWVFCAEAVKHGLHILFDPEIIIHHHNRSRFSGYLTHQFHLGENNAAARLMTNDPRKILRKFKPLLLFLPFIKTAKNYLKILFLNPVQFPRFLLYSPLILTGIFIESAGYARIMGRRTLSVQETGVRSQETEEKLRSTK